MIDKTYRVSMVKGIKYVLTTPKSVRINANFMNSGMALAGILRNEELQEFLDRQPDQTERHSQINESLLSVSYQVEYVKRLDK